MKFTVEMNAEEFDEFMNYRKDKETVTRDYRSFQAKAYNLRKGVLRAIRLDEKQKEVVLDYEDAQAVVKLAYEVV